MSLASLASIFRRESADSNGNGAADSPTVDTVDTGATRLGLVMLEFIAAVVAQAHEERAKTDGKKE
jgi:hypothetical protein